MRYTDWRPLPFFTFEQKIQLLDARVFSILLYAADTWTSKKSEEKTLAAFEMCCYQRLLCVRWQDFQTNESIRSQLSRQHTIVDRVRRRKLKLFGHICCMLDNSLLKKRKCCSGWWKVATTRNDQGSARLTIYWNGAIWRHTTRSITPCTRSCEVKNFHSWPLRLLNHGKRKRSQLISAQFARDVSCSSKSPKNP